MIMIDSVKKYKEPQMNADKRRFIEWSSKFININQMLIRPHSPQRAQRTQSFAVINFFAQKLISCESKEVTRI